MVAIPESLIAAATNTAVDRTADAVTTTLIRLAVTTPVDLVPAFERVMAAAQKLIAKTVIEEVVKLAAIRYYDIPESDIRYATREGVKLWNGRWIEVSLTLSPGR